MIEELKFPEIESRDAVIVRALTKIVNGPTVDNDSLESVISLAKADNLLPVFTWLVQELLVDKGYKLYDLLDSLAQCYQTACPGKDEEIRLLGYAAKALAAIEDPTLRLL